MINRYLIFERYEHWGKNGKTWTDWFRTYNTPFAKTEEEAIPFLNEMKKFSSNFDKHTKLKHEFQIKLIDIETLPHIQIRYSKRGRPSKAEMKKKQYEYDNYWKIFIEEYDKRNERTSQ